MRKKKVIYPNRVEEKNIPSKYDQELLKQIREIQEFPRIEPLVRDDQNIKAIKSNTTASINLIKAAGLLYDFRNPKKTEQNIKKVVTDKRDYSDQEIYDAFSVPNDEIESNFTSVYKSDQLWKFHEAIRISGAYSNALEKTFDFVTGIDYTHLETDVNDSFPDKDMKNIELEKINNNFIIFSLKNELEEIDRNVNLRHKILSLMINKRTFGRAAQKIVTNENTNIPEAIEILFPMLLGRVFYTKRTKEIVGIEYDDDDPEHRLIPSSKLIYATNRDYGQSPGSLFYGYSDAEYLQHLVETNFIIDAYDLKEINRNSYVAKKIVQVLDSDPNVITTMTNTIRESDQVVTKYPVKVDSLDNDHSGDFLIEERRANEDKMTTDLQMPNILMGRQTSDTFAIATQVMQSFNETTANKFRMEIREVYEEYYQKNLKQSIKNRLEFLNTIKSKYVTGDRTSDTILEELLVYNKDDLTDEEVKSQELLKQEYKLQRDREKWERYREEFIDKRLKIIKGIINENDSISPEDADKIFEEIKKQVETNQSFELEDFSKELPKLIPQPKPDPQFIPPLRPKPKPVQVVKQQQLKPVAAAADFEPPKPNDPSIPKPEPTDEPDDGTEWQDNSLPSPSSIEFEIQELEKLVVLEPFEYPFKYKMVFKNVSLLTDLEKSASIIAQKKEGILDVEDARKELEYEDVLNREQLKTRLSEQIMDIIKRYVKPEPQPMGFGNKLRETIDTAEEIKQFMEGEAPVPPPSNGQGKRESKSPLNFGLTRAVNAQGTKKPLVKIDTTSTP
jgi:hypothetical protein